MSEAALQYFPESWPLFFDFFIPFPGGSGSKSGSGTETGVGTVMHCRFHNTTLIKKQIKFT
jgi:hypothetical protein